MQGVNDYKQFYTLLRTPELSFNKIMDPCSVMEMVILYQIILILENEVGSIDCTKCYEPQRNIMEHKKKEKGQVDKKSNTTYQ